MSIQRFKSLLFKSAWIKREIEEEQQRRWPDWLRLLKLKKLNLKLKDHISKLMKSDPSGTLTPVKVRIRSARNRPFRPASV